MITSKENFKKYTLIIVKPIHTALHSRSKIVKQRRKNFEVLI